MVYVPLREISFKAGVLRCPLPNCPLWTSEADIDYIDIILRYSGLEDGQLSLSNITNLHLEINLQFSIFKQNMEKIMQYF